MRHIITLLLMLPVLADAQIYIDSYRFGIAPTAGILLDSYPGAVAAFSFRRLSTSYNGDAIMVVRSSDQDSSDIGFAGNYLDTVALKNFCGTGATDSCFVRTWYDQSGDGRHARNSDYPTLPEILVAGNIVYRGSNVALMFRAKRINMPANIGLASQSIFTAMALDSAITETSGNTSVWRSDSLVVTNNFAFGATTGGLTNERHAWFTATGAGVSFGSGQTTTNLSATRYLWTHMFNLSSPTTQVYKNGSLESMTNLTNGAFSGTNYPRSWNLRAINIVRQSHIEIIVYPSYQSTNRAAIETNINTFYSIY
jgi:hypothetical protein